MYCHKCKALSDIVCTCGVNLCLFCAYSHFCVILFKKEKKMNRNKHNDINSVVRSPRYRLYKKLSQLTYIDYLYK